MKFKILSLFFIVITGIILIYGVAGMPDLADPDSPASRHVSPEYIQNTYKDAHTPNMVTTILADYRGYDTLGETTVIFTAGIACILLLKNLKGRKSHD
ncbi:MAG: hypothetical protein JW864_17230 [Spirochaetes bacterium]|nr:hypothetical protein [Spirochaetota bacterium]